MVNVALDVGAIGDDPQRVSLPRETELLLVVGFLYDIRRKGGLLIRRDSVMYCSR